MGHLKVATVSADSADLVFDQFRSAFVCFCHTLDIRNFILCVI
jgi:hypothetical protein